MIIAKPKYENKKKYDKQLLNRKLDHYTSKQRKKIRKEFKKVQKEYELIKEYININTKKDNILFVKNKVNEIQKQNKLKN